MHNRPEDVEIKLFKLKKKVEKNKIISINSKMNNRTVDSIENIIRDIEKRNKNKGIKINIKKSFKVSDRNCKI